MIPEWAPQRAVWVGWPRLPEEWGEAFGPARGEIAGFVRALAAYVPVRLAVGDDEAARDAESRLASVCEIRRIPTGDIWLRDTGPIFTSCPGGRLGAHAFLFNGWGGKYVMPGDAETATALAEAERAKLTTHGFVLEGGAIETDGAGRLVTTRECLLHPNRNRWRRSEAEAALKAVFGIGEIVWLDHGLIGDHTDGHVDNIARFVAPGHVVCQTPTGKDDPQAARLSSAEAALRAAGLNVSTLPSPGCITDANGAVLAASHLNFLITNDAVLMPDFASPCTEAAAGVLADLFPGRAILPLPARHILAGGGTFHCMTREVPRLQQTGAPA